MGSGSRLLITGASGFVGSHLARRCVADGADVHLVVRPTSSLDQLKEARDFICPHVHDGTTEGMTRILGAVKPDVVFHLGSRFVAHHKSSDVTALVQSNVLFGAQLAEAMVASGSHRLVNTGTSWQHFHDDPYRPVSLYAATKQAFEDLLAYFVDATPLRAVSLHLFDTYGPDDPRPKLLHLLGSIAASGTSLAMSPGEQRLDLVHIDDVVDAFLLAADRLVTSRVQTHEIYAVSAGQTLTLRELVAAYERVVGRPIAIGWGGRPYRDREVMHPWSTGKPVPGWSPRISLDAGLASLVGDAKR